MEFFFVRKIIIKIVHDSNTAQLCDMSMSGKLRSLLLSDWNFDLILICFIFVLNLTITIWLFMHMRLLIWKYTQDKPFAIQSVFDGAYSIYSCQTFPWTNTRTNNILGKLSRWKRNETLWQIWILNECIRYNYISME